MIVGYFHIQLWRWSQSAALQSQDRISGEPLSHAVWSCSVCVGHGFVQCIYNVLYNYVYPGVRPARVLLSGCGDSTEQLSHSISTGLDSSGEDVHCACTPGSDDTSLSTHKLTMLTSALVSLYSGLFLRLMSQYNGWSLFIPHKLQVFLYPQKPCAFAYMSILILVEVQSYCRSFLTLQ